MEPKKKLAIIIIGIAAVFFIIVFVSKREKPIQFVENVKILGPILKDPWYPSDPEKLKNWIDTFLKENLEYDLKNRRLFGLIVPHAGYFYSGRTAAAGYKLLLGNTFSRVVIIAPSHHARAPEISIPQHEFYETTLGKIPIDQEAISQLRKNHQWITHNPSLYEREHSLEVQLPFLQTVLKEFRLIPIYMGDNDISLAQKLASALSETIGEKALYVASTDLSHYHPFRIAEQLDRETIRLIQEKKPELLNQAVEEGKSELCGLGPVLTLLYLFQNIPGGTAELIKYETSGDVTGDRRNVVGYGAIALVYQ